MRALHVFPMFGPELGGGSDYVQFHLSRQLVRAGIEVEVLATRSDKPIHQLRTTITNDRGTTVLDGTATVYQAALG